MKKSPFAFASLSLVTVLSFMLTACVKGRILLPGDINQFCQIDTINVDGQLVKVTNNEAGDPVSMLPINHIANGPWFNNIYFKYDKYRRLTAYLNFYSTNTFPDF